MPCLYLPGAHTATEQADHDYPAVPTKLCHPCIRSVLFEPSTFLARGGGGNTPYPILSRLLRVVQRLQGPPPPDPPLTSERHEKEVERSVGGNGSVMEFFVKGCLRLQVAGRWGGWGATQRGIKRKGHPGRRWGSVLHQPRWGLAMETRTFPGRQPSCGGEDTASGAALARPRRGGVNHCTLLKLLPPLCCVSRRQRAPHIVPRSARWAAFGGRPPKAFGQNTTRLQL